MNWGSFAGGLAQGAMNGLSLGKALKGILDESALDEIRKKGIEEVNATIDKSASDMVTSNQPELKSEDSISDANAAKLLMNEGGLKDVVKGGGLPAIAKLDSMQGEQPVIQQQVQSETVQPVVGVQPLKMSDELPVRPQTDGVVQPLPSTDSVLASGLANGRFSVGERQFDTREDAIAYAKKNKSPYDLYAEKVVPQISARYREQGDLEKADYWDKYAEGVKGKRGIREFSKALLDPTLDGAAKKFGNYMSEFVNPDLKLQKVGEMVIGKDGVPYVDVSFTDASADGKVTNMQLTKDLMLKYGMAHSPDKLFDSVYKENQDEKARKDKAIERIHELQIRKADKQDDREYNRETQKQIANTYADAGIKKAELGAGTKQDTQIARENKDKQNIAFRTLTAELNAARDALKNGDPNAQSQIDVTLGKMNQLANPQAPDNGGASQTRGKLSKSEGVYDPKGKVVYRKGDPTPYQQQKDGTFAPVKVPAK